MQSSAAIPPRKKGGYSLGAGPNESNRVDTANDGHPLSGIYADYQFVNSQIYPDSPPPHPSEIVLLLELSNSQVNVRAFNTSTNTEVFAPYYPYVLSW